MNYNNYTALLTLFILFPMHSYAHDARAFIPPPDNSCGILVYGQHYSANKLYSNGELQTDDVDYKTDIGIARFAWYPKLGPFLTSLQAYVPFGKSQLKIPGNTGSVTSSGIGDPTILSGIYIINDRAAKTWFGVAGYITAPLGEYDNNKSVNLGSNRWKFKGELGLTKGFGNFFIDIAAGASWFGDNDEYGPTRNVLEQSKEYHIETHFSYNLTPSVYAALDYYYLTGGEQYLNGNQITKSENNNAAQVEIAFHTTPLEQLMVYYRRDLRVEDGLKQDMLGIRYYKFF